MFAFFFFRGPHRHRHTLQFVGTEPGHPPRGVEIDGNGRQAPSISNSSRQMYHGCRLWMGSFYDRMYTMRKLPALRCGSFFPRRVIGTVFHTRHCRAIETNTREPPIFPTTKRAERWKESHLERRGKGCSKATLDCFCDLPIHHRQRCHVDDISPRKRELVFWLQVQSSTLLYLANNHLCIMCGSAVFAKPIPLVAAS